MVLICPGCSRDKTSDGNPQMFGVLQNKLFPLLAQKVFGSRELLRDCTYIKAIMESKRDEETEDLPNLKALGAMKHSQLPKAIVHLARQHMRACSFH